MLTYPQILDYLNSFANFETRTPQPVGPGDFSLDRVRGLLDRLGSPEVRYPSIHVAGTKGKGSTSAMLASVLQAAGLRVGLYTSPHLHVLEERIQIDGQPISMPELIDLVARVRPSLDRDPSLTTFEAMTALALAHFANKQVDWAVVEVGLGGRLDATNVITPRVSILTPLSLEHTAILGRTLTRIAWEKAGIIKPGVPAVTAPQPSEALTLIQAIARERQSPLTIVGHDWTWRRVGFNLDGQTFEVGTADRLEPAVELRPRRHTRYWIPLLGAHQVVNATTAIATLHVLRQQGTPIPEEAVTTGLARVRWPGRLEILSRQPLLVVDGAHNVESMERLAEALDELFPHRRRILVFGASGGTGITTGQDLPGMLRQAQAMTHSLILTRSRHPRAADPLELRALVPEESGAIYVTTDVPTALRQAFELAEPEDLIGVAGSLYVVAEARQAILPSP